MSSRTTKLPVDDGKLSLPGCIALGLALLAFFVVMFIITALVFTWAFNIVSPIFGGPTITSDQGFVLWFLIVFIGSAFRRAV